MSFTGLHICEGERSEVSAPHCWTLRCQAVQEGPGTPSALCLWVRFWLNLAERFNSRLVVCAVPDCGETD